MSLTSRYACEGPNLRNFAGKFRHSGGWWALAVVTHEEAALDRAKCGPYLGSLTLLIPVDIKSEL